MPNLMLLPGPPGQLWRDTGDYFDPEERRWLPGTLPGAEAQAISAEAAVAWLQRESGARLRPPIGVIGARMADSADLALAERIGRDLARLGLVVLTGGKGGIMEATCRGVEAEGGCAVGLLPDEHWDGANGHVSIPLATGLGVARNAIVARASFALIVVSGGYGTLSEMAFGLQFERPVLALPSAPQVPGAVTCPDWPSARAALCAHILSL